MAAQRCDVDAHVGEQRQRHQQRVQLFVAGDVEDADVGVLPGDAPQVAPAALFLQALRERLFVAFRRAACSSGIVWGSWTSIVTWNSMVSPLLLGCAACGAACRYRRARPGPAGRHLQAKSR
jgi:hypothetical protein